jgi:hypothetical protein
MGDSGGFGTSPPPIAVPVHGTYRETALMLPCGGHGVTKLHDIAYCACRVTLTKASQQGVCRPLPPLIQTFASVRTCVGPTLCLLRLEEKTREELVCEGGG